MKRQLFKILAALSLLLCVALTFVWARSYLRAVSIIYTIAKQPHSGYRFLQTIYLTGAPST